MCVQALILLFFQLGAANDGGASVMLRAAHGGHVVYYKPMEQTCRNS